MQLFITDFKQNGDNIIIANPEILEQTRKVLRMKIGDRFFVQKENTRHEIEILDRDKTTIKGNIIKTENNQLLTMNSELGIIIAMPNKRAKAELIVQKLSEIGLDNICFRPSERSMLKNRNDKKMERLQKISQEAVEQSRGRTLPRIQFIKDISKIISDQKIIIFDKSNITDNFVSLSSSNEVKDLEKQNILGIIGPEGGLTQKDYEKFGKNYEIISLGTTVLRMETASIIGAWLLKNNINIIK